MKAYPDAYMARANMSDEVESAQVEAGATTRRRDRAAWILYAAMFVVLPFVVLLFRLHMQSWHYYIAGTLFVACALIVLALEFVAPAKCDKPGGTP